jgi:TetR/AcrR family transcriptional repressor of nem operon
MKESLFTTSYRFSCASVSAQRCTRPAAKPTAAVPRSIESGFVAKLVDALTEAAGMTHGSIYSQFGSKERLAVEAPQAPVRHA